MLILFGNCQVHVCSLSKSWVLMKSLEKSRIYDLLSHYKKMLLKRSFFKSTAILVVMLYTWSIDRRRDLLLV